MRTFEYIWSEDIFLLHIQLNNENLQESSCSLLREFQGGGSRREVILIKESTPSHRFIVSRTHPSEIKFIVEYPESINIEVFKVDDRAYYPTESFYSDI